MNELIQNICACLEKSESFGNDFIRALKASKIIWKENYPIAVVHSKERMKEASQIDFFANSGLLDEVGETPVHYREQELESIRDASPSSLKSARLLALSEEPKTPISYKVKRPNDYWKKIQDVGHIRSSLDLALFEPEEDICKVEFELREVIRSRKEVHAFKEIGFIWIAVTKGDVSEVFRHYFHDDYTVIDGQYHIGWSETLKAINMRYFVCPPQ